MRENCDNFRTRNDIAMKPGPVTKLDNGNTTTSKKIDYHVMANLWRIWSNPQAGFQMHGL